MKTRSIARFAGACAAVFLAVPGAQALEVVFDYRFDRGFFTNPDGSAIVERRQALELAARPYSGFSDALSAIAQAAGDTWTATFRHPSWSSFFETASVTDLTVAPGSVTLFVGGSRSGGSVLGMAEAGSTTASGSAAFVDSVAARGQPGALQALPTDYGPWGGSVWFNTNVNWYFGASVSGLGPTQSDFLTTATHEIGHLLGFGEAPAWSALVGGTGGAYLFNGAAASASYGGAVPLDTIGAHWAAGTVSLAGGVAQGTLMDPSTARGTRELLTDLDRAGFTDIGWQVSAVPEPPAAQLMLAGVLILAGLRRARRTQGESDV